MQPAYDIKIPLIRLRKLNIFEFFKFAIISAVNVSKKGLKRRRIQLLILNNCCDFSQKKKQNASTGHSVIVQIHSFAIFI